MRSKNGRRSRDLYCKSSLRSTVCTTAPNSTTEYRLHPARVACGAFLAQSLEPQHGASCTLRIVLCAFSVDFVQFPTTAHTFQQQDHSTQLPTTLVPSISISVSSRHVSPLNYYRLDFKSGVVASGCPLMPSNVPLNDRPDLHGLGTPSPEIVACRKSPRHGRVNCLDRRCGRWREGSNKCRHAPTPVDGGLNLSCDKHGQVFLRSV